MIGEEAAMVGGISQLKTHLQETEGAASGDQQNGSKQYAESELMVVNKQATTSDGEAANGADANAAEAGGDAEAAGQAKQGEEGEDPIDMSFPKEGGWKTILVYLVRQTTPALVRLHQSPHPFFFLQVSFPIMAPLYVTLPDTKNPDSKLC